MPLTISNFTGDGIATPQVSVSIEMPDSGTSYLIGGLVDPVAGGPIAVSGSPITAPAVPGSGTVYWIIQVDTTTGTATVKSSTSAIPVPDAGNITVFTQTLASTAPSNPVLVATNTTPDTY